MRLQGQMCFAASVARPVEKKEETSLMFSSSFVSAQRQQIVVGGCNAMIKREEEGFGRALEARSKLNLLNHSGFCQLQMDFHTRNER